MRDKLIQLLLAPMKLPIHNPKDFVKVTAEAYADRFLANGVVVLDTNIVSPENRPLIQTFAEMPLNEVLDLVKAKQEGLILVPPCKVGEEIWFVDRNESGEPIDITGAVFLAQSKGCIIATSYINDYDLTETIEYHINRTQDNYDTNLLVYPIEDCYVTKEEAEQALAERKSDNGHP